MCAKKNSTWMAERESEPAIPDMLGFSWRLGSFKTSITSTSRRSTIKKSKTKLTGNA